MDKLKLILVKILLLTTILFIVSTNTAEAKTKKSHQIIKELLHESKGHHRKIKRSAYGVNWGKSGYAASLPPYLVYNRKLGSYYPYYKYPENNLRRNMRRLYKEYAASNKYNKYSTLPHHLYKH